MRKTKRKTHPRSRRYLVPYEPGFSKGRRSNVVRQRTLTAYPSDKKTKETWPSSLHDISIAAKVFFKVATERDRLVKGMQGRKLPFQRVYTWGEYYKSAIVMKEKVHLATLRKSSPLSIHHDECRHNIPPPSILPHHLPLATSRSPCRTNLHIYGKCLAHTRRFRMHVN